MLEQTIIVSLIVFAIWYTMQEGEIFGKLGIWLHNNLPSWAHDPVFACPVCQVPYYGTVIALILGYEWWVIFPAMGLNVVIIKLWPKDD